MEFLVDASAADGLIQVILYEIAQSAVGHSGSCTGSWHHGALSYGLWWHVLISANPRQV
jgi:hypothetical protein